MFRSKANRFLNKVVGSFEGQPRICNHRNIWQQVKVPEKSQAARSEINALIEGGGGWKGSTCRACKLSVNWTGLESTLCSGIVMPMSCGLVVV